MSGTAAPRLRRAEEQGWDEEAPAGSAPLRLRPAPRLLFVDNQVEDFLRYRLVLARSMRESGFDVHVAVPPEPGVREISRHGFTVHLIYMRRKSARPIDELRCCVSLIRLYRRVRPTIVYHITLKPALYGGIAARITGVPGAVSILTGLGHLFTRETPTIRVLRSFVLRGLRFSFRSPNHRVVFQNADDRDCLLARGILPGGRAVLIKGSGVDLAVFTRRPELDGPPVVLMASRLLWEKGVGQFVAAARILRARGVEARFVLIGVPDPGHPSAIPVATLERWCNLGDVEWLGWGDDMPAVIARSHIVCLPTSYREGVPRVLLEAAACGRPIVASDSPGCREVVRHGENGLLVSVDRDEPLATAIAELIQHAPLRAAMGARGREIAEAEFSLAHVVDANVAVCRALLASIAKARDSSLGRIPVSISR